MESTSTGKLYIVSTPIGNLEDITIKALNVLREVDMIFAEDTRTTGNLLKHYNLPHKPIISFFEGNEQARENKIFNLLYEGKKLALVSESGTPLICDPGYKLIRELVRREMSIEAIPGPTALITALSISGFPPNSFLFLGYLPKKESRVTNVLARTKIALTQLDSCKTIVIYESPHRLLKTLHSIEDVFGDISIVVARELTKLHEEVRREKVSESVMHFTKNKPRGEFVLLLNIEKHD